MTENFADLFEQSLSEIDMTPMLDVVFILLIFFIVTSSIENTMKFDVTLPSASVTEKNDEKNLEIEIGADEIIRYEGQSYSLEEGYNILLQNGGDMKNLLIYADKDLRTEIFIKIADFSVLTVSNPRNPNNLFRSHMTPVTTSAPMVRKSIGSAPL